MVIVTSTSSYVRPISWRLDPDGTGSVSYFSHASAYARCSQSGEPYLIGSLQYDTHVSLSTTVGDRGWGIPLGLIYSSGGVQYKQFSGIAPTGHPADTTQLGLHQQLSAVDPSLLA